MVKQDRVSIRALKVAEFASEETLCYECKVLIDGKVIGIATNDGHGGSTYIQPANGGWNGPGGVAVREAETWARTLPPIKEEDYVIEITLDWLVDELAEAEHHAKKMRAACTRAMKSRVLFTKTDAKGVFQTKPITGLAMRLPAYVQNIMARHPGATILNTLPFDEALRLFTAAQEAE